MIIESQDKEAIVNFENVEVLGVGNPLENKNGLFAIIANAMTDNQYILGEYTTKERAKEVLHEIVSLYSSHLELKGGPAILQGQMDIQPNIFNIPKVYEMPEE